MADNQALEAFGALKIDDIEIVPGFRVPPPGVYNCDATCGLKLVNGNPTFLVDFTLNEDGDGYLKGDQCGVMWNAKGLIYNRAVFEQVLATFGAQTMQEAWDAGTMTVTATLGQRKDKNDPEKVYCNLIKIAPA